ncbi:hypothetical protein CALCODRAFT_69676 [Calocera cornea HHB12733]|uniref:Uncharacterized protein n=1 Tax=Calocera cornea HHB12733 TaxID=1353952 RepID=A0A165DIU4_9BASI|nr:hypothetical protein CALCODRAFT_69676 [Calocera cornea HHB12733]
MSTPAPGGVVPPAGGAVPDAGAPAGAPATAPAAAPAKEPEWTVPPEGCPIMTPGADDQWPKNLRAFSLSTEAPFKFRLPANPYAEGKKTTVPAATPDDKTSAPSGDKKRKAPDPSTPTPGATDDDASKKAKTDGDLISAPLFRGLRKLRYWTTNYGNTKVLQYDEKTEDMFDNSGSTAGEQRRYVYLVGKKMWILKTDLEALLGMSSSGKTTLHTIYEAMLTNHTNDSRISPDNIDKKGRQPKEATLRNWSADGACSVTAIARGLLADITKADMTAPLDEKLHGSQNRTSLRTFSRRT